MARMGCIYTKNIEEIDNKLVDGKVFKDYLTQTPNSSFSKMISQLKYDCLCQHILYCFVR